jgi:hypothetical protein
MGLIVVFVVALIAPNTVPDFFLLTVALVFPHAALVLTTIPLVLTLIRAATFLSAILAIIRISDCRDLCAQKDYRGSQYSQYSHSFSPVGPRKFFTVVWRLRRLRYVNRRRRELHCQISDKRGQPGPATAAVSSIAKQAGGGASPLFSISHFDTKQCLIIIIGSQNDLLNF